MTNVKTQVSRVLKQMPDDCTLEDVQYELYVLEMIRRRLELANRGKFVSQSQAQKRMAKWIAE